MNKAKIGLLGLNNFDSFVFAFIAFTLVVLVTRHSGIGISPDSIAYLSVARNLISNGSLMDFDLQPLVDFPVFYPWFLSVMNFSTGTDPVVLGPYLNGLLFAGIVIITGYLLGPTGKSNGIYKRIILFSIALSPALLEIYSMLWSETLFIFLSLLFIATFKKYFIKRTLFQLSICAAVAGIACITRYAGITVIATGVTLLVFDPDLKLKKKIVHLILFAVFSITILMANLWHNFMVTGLMTGPRERGITPLRDNIMYYAKVICKWLPVPVAHPVWYSFLVIMMFMIIVTMFLKSIYRHQTYTTAGNIFTVFFIVYTVFIIGISTLSHFEQINNRLLSPLFIPLLITLTFWLPGFIGRLKGEKFQLVMIGISLLALAFQINQLGNLNELYSDAIHYGVPGYTDDSWKNSPIVKFLKKYPGVFDPRFNIYSNAHEAVYFNGDIRSSSLPHKIDKGDIRDFFTGYGQYVIWFNQVTDPELISLNQIGKNARIFKKYIFKDGIIYFVIPKKRTNL